MRRATVVLLLLFTFAVPWEYSLELGDPFGNIARVLGLLVLVTGSLAVLLRRGIRPPGSLQWLVLALYLYFACTYLWTVDQQTTLDKIRGYFQAMMIVWLVWEFAESPRHLKDLMRAFVLGCWVLALLTFKDFTSASALAAAQIRFVAEGQDPNDVARFLDIGFPIAALLFTCETKWYWKGLAISYLPVGLLAVVLTASRGGFLAAIAALLGSVIVLIRWRAREVGGLLAGLALVAGTLWLMVPGESLERLATIPEQLGSSDLNDRVSIWTSGWHAFTQAPWCGYGAGSYPVASGLAAGDTAHNTAMAVLVTGGLIAFSLCVGILVVVGLAIVRTKGSVRIALGTTFAVWLLTAVVGSVEGNRTTWLLFALIAVAQRSTRQQPELFLSIFYARGWPHSQRSDCAIDQT